MKEYPKKIKFGRIFRIKLKNYNVSSNYLNVWSYNYGIKALENGRLKLFHFLALSRFLKKNFKKDYRIKFNISLNIPVTKKPKEARMGKGKAQRDHWECCIKKGMVIFEIGVTNKNISWYIFFKTLNRLIEKLPMYSTIIKLMY